jgi:hypothetical protein
MRLSRADRLPVRCITRATEHLATVPPFAIAEVRKFFWGGEHKMWCEKNSIRIDLITTCSRSYCMRIA